MATFKSIITNVSIMLPLKLIALLNGVGLIFIGFILLNPRPILEPLLELWNLLFCVGLLSAYQLFRHFELNERVVHKSLTPQGCIQLAREMSTWFDVMVPTASACFGICQVNIWAFGLLIDAVDGTTFMYERGTGIFIRWAWVIATILVSMGTRPHRRIC